MDRIKTISFCEPFLLRLVDHLETVYLAKGVPLDRLALVFGGKRPALFVKRELARRLRSTFEPPWFFTINEFVGHVVRKSEPFSPSGDMDDLYLLFHLAKQRTPEILAGRESFAKFLPWAREILAFIDHLDLENVENKALLDLKANAEIGYDVPEDINRLLRSVVELRQAYHQEMVERKTFSRGWQYLRAAELSSGVELSEFTQVLFCNFFYFNRCEEKIIKTLYDRGKAELIFQGDERKWPVLKRTAKGLGCVLEEGARPDAPGFDLKLYAGFDIHSQVGMAREILKGMDGEEQARTVVVLPHAEPIIPLLSEISGAVREFNVSMGYPLKRSSLHTLISSLFHVQTSRKEGMYYAKDYLKVIRHPFIKNLKLFEDSAVVRILAHKIEEILTGQVKTDLSGSLFLSLADVEDHDPLYDAVAEILARMRIPVTKGSLRQGLQEIHQVFFRRMEEVRTFGDFAGALGGALDLLVRKSFLGNFPLNLNIADKMYAIRDELMTASFCAERFPPEDIFRIFASKLEREIVAFRGSPLKGLQVLGLFETRSLNFDNVIVLDTNEGVMPNLKLYQPLIPREVMVSLNLDRLEWEEEIQRYQFMRLISSAKKVHMIYRGGKEGERSRFVEELIWEEQKSKGRLDVLRPASPCFQVQVAPRKRAVAKTPEMVAYLKTMRYSASSVNLYLKNPLEFYHRYVLGLREQDDMLDEPEAKQVGTFIHGLLEESFKPFLRKRPQIDGAFQERFERLFEERFREVFGKSAGTDAFLVRSVLVERLQRFIDNERSGEERKVSEILYLENRFEDIIPLSAGEFRFRYVVDRVDRMEDGTVLIVDYKTGSVDLMPRAAERLGTMALSREAIRDHVRSFQIPLYFYYLDKMFKDDKINAALYSLRTFELKKFVTERTAAPRAELIALHLKALDHVMSEIIDPQVPFVEDLSAGD